MEVVSVTVPNEFAAKVIASELNCFAYQPEFHAITYLRDFNTTKDGQNISVDIENYPVKEDQVDIIKLFDVDAFNGMHLINTSYLEREPDQDNITEYAAILTKLHQYMSETPAITAKAPVFGSMAEPPKQEMKDGDIMMTYPDFSGEMPFKENDGQDEN